MTTTTNRDGFIWLGRWVVSELEWVLAAAKAGRFGDAYRSSP